MSVSEGRIACFCEAKATQSIKHQMLCIVNNLIKLVIIYCEKSIEMRFSKSLIYFL